MMSGPSRRLSSSTITVIAGAFLAFAGVCVAQPARDARALVTVVDVTGAILPGATVTITPAEPAGAAGVTLMLLGAVCSMFGYMSGDMLSSPRSLYALARDGFLPRALARIHPDRRTPDVAIWTHAALAVIFASTNTFQSLAIISNVGLLLLYLLCCGAALELARRDIRTDSAPFTVPLPWLWPVAGGGLVLWILSTATIAEVAVTGIVLGIATTLYVAARTRSTRR